MSLRINICLSILIFNCSIAVSQLYYVTLPPGHIKLHEGDDRIPGVSGSPFLSDDWSMGSITLNNGKVIDSILLKYNVYNSEMQFQAGKEIFVLGSPDSVLFVTLNDKRFMYLPFLDKKKKPLKEYFEVYSGDGMLLILIRHTVEVIKSNYNVALNTGEKNDRLQHKKSFYLKKDNEIVLIDKKGENLFSLLKDKSKELRDFTSQNHLSFTKGDDLERIIKYYNSIYF